MNPVKIICFPFLCGMGIAIFQSCQHAPRNIPFPAQETEFSQPIVHSFQFSPPKNFHWVIPDKIETPGQTKLDFNKIPSQPFHAGGFKPMLQPIKEIAFDLDRLPDTIIDWNTVPSRKISFKTTLLGRPIRIKASWPHMKSGASYAIYEYGLENGLSTGGGMFAMLQDSKGLIWISTLNGLFRFDGEYFEQYGSAQGLENFNMIFRLLEDRKGKILAASPDGVDLINLNERTINHLDSTQVQNINLVRTMIEDPAGRIWFGTRNGIDILDQKTGEMKNLSMANGLSNNNIIRMQTDDAGRVWIQTETGMDVINLNNNKITHLAEALDLKNNKVTALYKDKQGKIWIGTKNGIDILSLKEKTRYHLSTEQGLSKNAFRDFSEGSPSQVWAWAEDKTDVDMIDLESKMLRHLSGNKGSGEYWFKFLRDNQGHIWMDDVSGTNLEFMNLEDGLLRQISLHNNFEKNLIGNFLEDSKGRIWLSNAGGSIYCIDLVKETIKMIDSAAGLPKILGYSLLAEDNQGRIWISGTETEGIYIADTKTGTLKHLTAACGLTSNIVSNFVRDDSGKIWICTARGLSVFDPDNGAIKNITQDQGLSSNETRSCMQDDHGDIWITTRNGIDIIDPKKETLKHLIIPEEQNVSSGYLITKDENRRMWINSYGHGLFMIDPDKRTLIHFTTVEGLSSDQLTSVETKNNIIYAGTSNGLSVVSGIKGIAVDDWQVKTYGKPQLFSHIDFNPFSLITKKGQFWWGVNADGVLIMDEPAADSLISPTHITGVDIMDRPQFFLNNRNYDSGYLKKNKIGWDSLTDYWDLPVNLRLPYNQNFIRFHFTGTHLGNIDKTRYRYILEGIDKSWNSISDKSLTETYRSLPPGDYTFKVASMGFNGLWSNPAELSFKISPPWWLTWWAYLLYAVIFVTLIRAYVQYRSRNLQFENQRLEDKITVRTKELRNSLEELKETQTLLIQQEKMASLGELTAGIAHEIQNPLNFVNNFSEVNTELIDEMEKEMSRGNLDDAKAIAKDVKENEQKISHHGKRADAIVKGMLQHSRISTGLKEPTDINNLADEYLRLAYHGLRAKDKSFNVDLQTQFDEKIGNINVVPQDIGRVLLNLFNNAFYATAERMKQHTVGYEPSVSVSTKETNGRIEISVKDNGNGIPHKVLDKIFQPFFTTKPAGQGTGLGLSLSYDIIKAHGGELKVETSEGAGAEFVVQIPAV